MTEDPVLEGVAAHQLLTGLSGALVYLVSMDGHDWFVRKVAAEPSGSPRLKGQAAKQMAFAEAIGDGPVRTPVVRDEGEVAGRYYFDMDFAAGTDGASYLRRASLAQVRSFADGLCEYLTRAAAYDVSGGEVVDLFEVLYGKVCDVANRTAAVDDEAMGRLFLMFEQVRRVGGVTTTLCHGDLTLENMVVDGNGQIWLLDLLDSPVEHYWQDVAKLHQDLSGGWYRRREEAVSRAVLRYVGDRVVDCATELDPGYPLVHRALLVTTFVRILPYVRDEEDRELVRRRIEHFTRTDHLPGLT